MLSFRSSINICNQMAPHWFDAFAQEAAMP
jgi:hypothetical protein